MRPALPARITVLAAVALLGPLAAGGCGAIENTQQVMNRADLVDDLAARLDRAATELDYTAKYQLPGGKAATIAHARKPVRSAYAYPGGKVVISTTATAECTAGAGSTRCTLTPPPLSTSGPPAGVLDAAKAQGLVDPTFVMRLLTTAALDHDARIEPSDTTIAGQHATCVDVSGVENGVPPAFGACITADGALGSFHGDLGGRPVELALSHYAQAADATEFDLPPGARITDQRPR
jgi:hypothetical protein